MRSTSFFAALLIAGIAGLGWRLYDERRGEQLFERAVQARHRRRYAEARDLCGKVLERRPAHAGARHLGEELEIIRQLRLAIYRRTWEREEAAAGTP